MEGAHLEYFHPTDKGCQASQALAATATQANQQHVAAWLTQHPADAAHVLHSKQEHCQIHRPLAHTCNFTPMPLSSIDTQPQNMSQSLQLPLVTVKHKAQLAKIYLVSHSTVSHHSYALHSKLQMAFT